jgi:hypothetical protein
MPKQRKQSQDIEYRAVASPHLSSSSVSYIAFPNTLPTCSHRPRRHVDFIFSARLRPGCLAPLMRRLQWVWPRCGGASAQPGLVLEPSLCVLGIIGMTWLRSLPPQPNSPYSSSPMTHLSSPSSTTPTLRHRPRRVVRQHAPVPKRYMLRTHAHDGATAVPRRAGAHGHGYRKPAHASGRADSDSLAFAG